MQAYLRLVTLCAASFIVACGGDRAAEEDQMSRGPDDMPAPIEETDTAGGMSAGEANISPQLVALGESVFEGKTGGGICYTCHGPDATGTKTGPDLTDQQWLNATGNLESIEQVVREGVPEPKQFDAPMPAFGSTLSDEHVKAVSAYVFSLSHPQAGGEQAR
jgi:cbb3-type cytochrome c oxidase subunit III